MILVYIARISANDQFIIYDSLVSFHSIYVYF
jgi:hypothetical protein